MGAADIVPGVSGGTIAFISGIYFRLLSSISAALPAAVKHLPKGRFREFWAELDGTFLLTLFAGIVTSIIALASFITYALDTWPIVVWSFFFGLIVASVWHVGREIRDYRAGLLIPLLLGIGFGYWVTIQSVVPLEPSPLLFFGAGAIAICAMILPGISGSFILLLMGMYAPVLAAVKELELVTLLLFAGGCLLGLLSIARVLTWAIKRHHDLILGFLTGLMIGALNKVWPWKEVISTRINSHDQVVPVEVASVSPWQYAELAGADPKIGLAILAALIGAGLVLAFEWLTSSRQRSAHSAH